MRIVTRHYFERDDAIHSALRRAQKRISRHLWVPADAVTFKPAVSGNVYGDGRALFWVNTCNDRPRFWIIRGCSTWSVSNDVVEGKAAFSDICDRVHADLEDEFGHRWEDDDGNELKRPRPYPAICSDSFSWGRMDWPKLAGVDLVGHPLDPTVSILAPRHFARPGKMATPYSAHKRVRA